MTSAIAETQTRIAGLRADVGRKKSVLRLLKESSKVGAAAGAANLVVLRQASRCRSGPEEGQTGLGRARRAKEQVGGRP
jgi:shikimate 5-dehydrogenase